MIMITRRNVGGILCSNKPIILAEIHIINHTNRSRFSSPGYIYIISNRKKRREEYGNVCFSQHSSLSHSYHRREFVRTISFARFLALHIQQTHQYSLYLRAITKRCAEYPLRRFLILLFFILVSRLISQNKRRKKEENPYYQERNRNQTDDDIKTIFLATKE